MVKISIDKLPACDHQIFKECSDAVDLGGIVREAIVYHCIKSDITYMEAKREVMEGLEIIESTIELIGAVARVASLKAMREKNDKTED